MNNKDTIDTVLKAYLDGDRSDKVAKAIFEWTEKSLKMLACSSNLSRF